MPGLLRVRAQAPWQLELRSSKKRITPFDAWELARTAGTFPIQR
jgi:hypothetical protein